MFLDTTARFTAPRPATSTRQHTAGAHTDQLHSLPQSAAASSVLEVQTGDVTHRHTVRDFGQLRKYEWS
jgi:hypothetical protein